VLSTPPPRVPAAPTCRYELLSRLAALRPGARFSLIVGGDLVDSLPRWASPAALLAECAFIVVPREGWDVLGGFVARRRLHRLRAGAAEPARAGGLSATSTGPTPDLATLLLEADITVMEEILAPGAAHGGVDVTDGAGGGGAASAAAPALLSFASGASSTIARAILYNDGVEACNAAVAATLHSSQRSQRDSSGITTLGAPELEWRPPVDGAGGAPASAPLPAVAIGLSAVGTAEDRPGRPAGDPLVTLPSLSSRGGGTDGDSSLDDRLGGCGVGVGVSALVPARVAAFISWRGLYAPATCPA
jgi:hypothetical protein